MRIVLITVAIVAAMPRPSEACVQMAEANTLLGWSADGTVAVHAQIDGGKMTHAEILPTRYEGWKYIITPSDGDIVVRKIAVASCAVFETQAEIVERAKGALTDDSLRRLQIVAGLKLVEPPTDDGGASKLTARFTPAKRYAEHQVEVRDAKAHIATLPVPVWCLGSCIRDEAWQSWGATITKTAKVGNRILYVIRMARVCNGGNDKDLWIERVIAVPGKEKRTKRGRCRGSGEAN